MLGHREDSSTIMNVDGVEEYIRKNKASVQSLDLVIGENIPFQFTCTQCGDCCRGGGNVYFSEDELKQVYDYLEVPDHKRRKFGMKFLQGKDNGYYVHSSGVDCWFLEDGKCSIYPVRPLQCRTYPFWPSCFQDKASYRELKKECPGCKRPDGKEFTRFTTVRRINSTMKKFAEGQQDYDKLFML